MSIPRKHISLEIAEDVKTICRPLFTKTKINYFDYCRLYDSGHLAVLLNRPDFHHFYWEHGFDAALCDYREGILFNNKDCKLAEIEAIAKYDFGMDNFFTKIKRIGDYLEVVSFTTSPGEDSIIEYYLKNQHELDLFTEYFKDVGQQLIQKVEKDMLFSGHYQKKGLPARKKSTLSDLKIKKYNIYNSFVKKHFHITPKQYKLLKYIAKGFTSKEIADVLLLSSRTIEARTGHLKYILNCQDRFQLLKLYHENFN